jgi:hypothetical protein
MSKLSMHSEQQKTEVGERGQSALEPFAIAAGLLRNDISILLPMFGVLALSSIFEGLSQADRYGDGGVNGLTILGRLLQLIVVSFVVLRWRRKLEHVKGSLGSPFLASLKIIAVGFAVWSALELPMIGIGFARVEWAAPIFLFAFCIAVFWAFRLYFYFAAFGLLGGTTVDALKSALLLGQREPGAVIRSLVTPMAATALVVGILSYPAPDGRSLFWDTASSAAIGIFWILSTYTGMAFSLVLIDDSAWRAAGLDPYRHQRLRTLEAQGRASRFNWLSVRSGLKIFLVAFCVIGATTFMGLVGGPAAQIKVTSYQVKNRGLSVVLEMDDPQFKFRGFAPHSFYVATQTGLDLVSNGIEKISLTPNGEALRGPIPSQTGPMKLYIDFSSRKTDDALKAMDNMYLWYNFKAVTPLLVQDQEPPAPKEGPASPE